MDRATQAQIARVIFDSIAEGRAVTDAQRGQLATYILTGMAPADEGPLSRELDAVEALEAVDAACRRLMICAAEDQSTVLAVGAALDAVRVEIRKQINSSQ